MFQAGRRTCAGLQASLGGASRPLAPAPLLYQPEGIPTLAGVDLVGVFFVKIPSYYSYILNKLLFEYFQIKC